ncbi:MAG: hypothetical protein WAN69_11935 [Candidatus Korobacteraceae bacterium]
MRRLGIRNVRPLLGGYHAWKELGYPLEEVPPPVEAAGTEGTLAGGVA